LETRRRFLQQSAGLALGAKAAALLSAGDAAPASAGGAAGLRLAGFLR
jgi:hypothetical protein